MPINKTLCYLYWGNRACCSTKLYKSLSQPNQMESDKDIQEIEKEYNPLKEKYNLPEFKKLAEDFDIEKVVEKETSFLLREIRRAIAEKISAYLHLFETLVNPASPPVFVFNLSLIHI